MSALKMEGGTVSLEPGGASDALLPFDMRSPFSGDAGRHLKSMQERTCRRGTIEFVVFSRLEYGIYVNSSLSIRNASSFK
jgi:hypothetical protein